MRNTETGEFELTVGNRQLLSGFFIVVLLFAVAFAMGYVVGQNSPRSSKVTGDTAAASSPVPGDSRPQAAAPAPTQIPAPAPADTGTQAPAETVAPPPAQAAANPPAEAAKEPQKSSKEPDRPATASEIPVLTELPGPSGSFWQVVALAPSDAEVIAAALKKKGFPAFLSPGTKGLMRVMVGPYHDTSAMGKAKVDLASAGFNTPFRK